MNSSVCLATHANVPGNPGACRALPPVTKLQSTGGAPGNNGWLVSPVVVTLVPTDVSGTGIARTEYGFDGSTWSTYSGPFTLPNGDFTFFYRSIDNAGNVEIAKTQPYRIDTVAPVAVASAVPEGDLVRFAYSLSDAQPGSGPFGVHGLAKGATAPVDFFSAGASGSLLVATQCADIEYWGEDVAGNLQSPHARTHDAQPPMLSVAPASFCAWPPDFQRLKFQLAAQFSATASDQCDAAPAVRIVSVTANEATSPGDITFSDTAACVKRTRLGNGPGRTYTIVVEAKDYSGNTVQKTVQVLVPHTSTSGCGVSGQEIADSAPCQ